MAITVYISDVTADNKEILYSFTPSSVNFVARNEGRDISYEQYKDIIKSLNNAQSFVGQGKDELIEKLCSNKGAK